MSFDSDALTDVERVNLRFLETVAQDKAFLSDIKVPEIDLELFRSLMFLEHAKPRPRVLDAGCGIARYASELADFFTYEGVDISEGMLKHARDDNPHLKFRRESFLRRTSFKEGRFDGIWCCCALNSTPKREVPKALKEFKRILGHRGVLLLMMPMHGYSDEGMEETTFNVPLYYASWFPDEFAKTVNDAGFKNVVIRERPESGSFTVTAQK